MLGCGCRWWHIGCEGDVAGLFDEFLAGGGEEEVDEFLGVLGTRPHGDNAKVAEEGVGTVLNVLKGWGNAVNGEEFDVAIAEHFFGEVTEGEADGFVVIAIVGNIVDNPAHAAKTVFTEGWHNGGVAHETLQAGLAAAAFIALEGFDVAFPRRIKGFPTCHLS